MRVVNRLPPLPSSTAKASLVHKGQEQQGSKHEYCRHQGHPWLKKHKNSRQHQHFLRPGHTMQTEQDKTYTIGDEELAIVANALWTDGVHVEFEDIQTACRRYPGDLTTVTAKLRDPRGDAGQAHRDLLRAIRRRALSERCGGMRRPP